MANTNEQTADRPALQSNGVARESGCTIYRHTNDEKGNPPASQSLADSGACGKESPALHGAFEFRSFQTRLRSKGFEAIYSAQL